MRAGFNGSMDTQLLTALQDFYEEIMLCDGIAAAECDATVAAPAAEILRRICRSSSLVYSRTHCFSARLGQMDVQGKSWQSLHLFQST